jgi:hypothetical protein
MTDQELKAMCKSRSATVERFADWIEARNRSCRLIDQGYIRFPFNMGFLCARPTDKSVVAIIED